MIAELKLCANARSAISSPFSFCRRVDRCCLWEMRCATRRAATTTPTAKTMRSAGLIWDKVEEEHALFRFVSGLLHFRQTCNFFGDRGHWFEPATQISYGTACNCTNQTGAISHTASPLNCLIPKTKTITEHLFIVLNAYWEPLDFQLPNLAAGRRWASSGRHSTAIAR